MLLVRSASAARLTHTLHPIFLILNHVSLGGGKEATALTALRSIKKPLRVAYRG